MSPGISKCQARPLLEPAMAGTELATTKNGGEVLAMKRDGCSNFEGFAKLTPKEQAELEPTTLLCVDWGAALKVCVAKLSRPDLPESVMQELYDKLTKSP